MSRIAQPFGSRLYDRQGVRYSQHQAFRPHGTDYDYEPPRRMLAAVKESMMHPNPPSIRRLDRDRVLCKQFQSNTLGTQLQDPLVKHTIFVPFRCF